MPLKEIAVSPADPDKEKSDEVKLCPLDKNKERTSETSDQLRNLDKTNTAFNVDPKDDTKTESKMPQDAASGSVTSGSVTSGSVTSGSVTSGSVTSGSVTSGSVTSGSVTSGSVTSGSVTSGSVTSGSVTSGSGSVTSGSGSVTSGSGSATSGSWSATSGSGSATSGSGSATSGSGSATSGSGSATSGSATSGSATSGSATSGSATSGSTTMPDTTMPDTTMPDTTMPDTTMPDTTMPDTTMPDTTMPDTTMPDTTMPDTTMPDTTMPDTTTEETKISQKRVALFTASSQKNDIETEEPSSKSQSSAKIMSRNNSSNSSVCADICRICHCEGDNESPLITPCLCLGSLQHVHQACIQQWIKSSNTKACELCRFPFVMQTKLKPIGKWEKLDMTTSERRKIICSVSFHIIAITCVVWALYVLIDRTTMELQKSGGVTEWPFWTKLVVVAIGFTGGLVFMYVQCKVYLHLWRRLKAYNRVIYVQNCPPEECLKAKQAKVVPEPPHPQVEIIT